MIVAWHDAGNFVDIAQLECTRSCNMLGHRVENQNVLSKHILACTRNLPTIAVCDVASGRVACCSTGK